MNLNDLEVLPEFNLGRCKKCPRALHLFTEFTEAQNTASLVAEHALEFPSDDAARKVEELLENLKTMSGDDELIRLGSDGTLIETTEDLEAFIRRATNNMVEARDQITEELSTQLHTLLEGCIDGPLRMRASKNGHQVIATVCMSSDIEDGEHCEDVHTVRTTQ